MDEAQINAIESSMTDLCAAIESDLFVAFVRTKCLLKRSEADLINRESTNDLKVLKSFDLLMPKEGSWTATIEFLDEHKLCPNTLRKLKSLHMPLDLQMESLQVGQTPVTSDWRQFIRDVVDFYLGDYRVVESFDVDGVSDPIESVWVDLQLEGSLEPISHYGEIFAEMRAKNCRLAIVRGQPGSGKTTLVKKIAYDWAKEEKKEIFDLILAVPLRDVQSKSDLLKMAVGFHLDNDDDIKQICADFRREKLKILIILDGLDEFIIPSNSPLSKIFGSGLSGFNILSAGTVRLDFELLVTSRPYACHLIHANIMAVRYEIVGFSEGKQAEFVLKRCKKTRRKSKGDRILQSVELPEGNLPNSSSPHPNLFPV